MKKYLERAMTFGEYRSLIERLVEERLTSGPRQSEALAHFTRLNLQRMTRLEKTLQVEDTLKVEISGFGRRQIWLVITEAWCGDAAQDIPVIEKIASENGIIETRYLLRDENPELIDRFLTFGARSIPKLIALDADFLEVLWTWGARPAAAQDLYFEMRNAAAVEKPAIMERLQRWYNEDKGISVQHEIVSLMKSSELRMIARAAT